MNMTSGRQAAIALALVLGATGGSAQTVSLPPMILPGEPVRVTISGAPPREEVTIVAEKGVAQGGQASWFASQATFLSGAAGGDLDGTWASGPMARTVAARRKAEGLETTLLTFDRAGHGINGSGWEPLNYPGLDSDPGALAHAQQQVRQATLELFGRILKPQPLPESVDKSPAAQ